MVGLLEVIQEALPEALQEAPLAVLREATQVGPQEVLLVARLGEANLLEVVK